MNKFDAGDVEVAKLEARMYLLGEIPQVVITFSCTVCSNNFTDTYPMTRSLLTVARDMHARWCKVCHELQAVPIGWELRDDG